MASILVVGGGLAGLACAWRLQQLGHDVEVLERESEAGGRARSPTQDGFRLERQPSFLLGPTPALRAVADGLGMETVVQRVDPPIRCAVLGRAGFEEIDLATPSDWLRMGLISRRARFRLARFALGLVRQRKSLDPARPERAAPLERDDAATDLARGTGVATRDALIEPLLAPLLGGELAESSDAFARIVLRVLAEGVSVASVLGGAGRIASALAARVPLRPGCEVVSVETGPGGARVRYRSGARERSALADAAVVAVPGPLVRALCPVLTPVEHDFFAALRSAAALEVQLLFDEPPRIGSFLQALFPTTLGLELSGVSLEHRRPDGVPAGAGLLRARFAASVTPRLTAAPDDRIAARALASLARTPIGALNPRAVRVQRELHALPCFGLGSLHRLEAFRTRREATPRLAFAGDYLIGPYTEAALRSGLRAAADTVWAFDPARAHSP